MSDPHGVSLRCLLDSSACATDLEILAIDPAAQRLGYGKALLEAVLAEADRDHLPVFLEASAGELAYPSQGVPPWVLRNRGIWQADSAGQTVGTGLYRKHGFVECAERASCGPDGAISVRAHLTLARASECQPLPCSHVRRCRSSRCAGQQRKRRRELAKTGVCPKTRSRSF